MKTTKRIFIITLTLILLGFFLPENLSIPVEKATSKDWNPKTFWYYPWGKSVTHKGIDIFAPKGRPVIAPTYGIVLYAGELKYGGNAVLLLGPKWRFHYFAHLEEITCKSFSPASKNKKLGTVGDSGNAKGKAPHLHYSVVTVFPYPWRIDSAPQGWKKMFYLNPIELFQKK